MPTIVWIIIIIIAVVFWSWLIYEVWNAPMMPDDYDIEEEDLNSKNENN